MSTGRFAFQAAKRLIEFLAGWLRGGLANTDVEDVAFGIGHGRPSCSVFIELSDLGCAEGYRPLHVRLNVGSHQVEVHSVLALARLGYCQEHQSGKAAVLRRWDRSEELVGAVGDRTLQQCRPEGRDVISAL